MSHLDLDRANARLLEAVNQSGDVFISHTSIRGQYALRIAIGHIDTTERHVRHAWDLVVESAGALKHG
jgi:aromatic-L-amino-acid decarboxylase